MEYLLWVLLYLLIGLALAMASLRLFVEEKPNQWSNNTIDRMILCAIAWPLMLAYLAVGSIIESDFLRKERKFWWSK